MLHLLFQYAREHGIDLEPGFNRRLIQWGLSCNREGEFIQVVRLGDASKARSGREFVKCPELSFSDLKSGGETKSHFLAEKVAVVALYGKDIDAKTQAKHAYFIDLLRQASTVMPELVWAANCLTDETQLNAIQRSLEEQKAKSTDNITIQIEGSFPIDSSVWHDWWRHFRAGLAASRGEKENTDVESSRMRCYVTGQVVKPAATHPKIEGLMDVGGASVGSPLVGFNKPSYCSYGLQQSANAAVSEEAAASYRAGLNFLIQRHSQKLAGAKIVHWFRAIIDAEDDPFPWLTEGKAGEEVGAQQRANELLRAIREGKRPNLAQNHYYAMSLSGATGRVMVRDWMEGQFEDLVQHVLTWFNDFSIVSRDGNGLCSEPRFIAVLASTVLNLDNLVAPFVTVMWRAAVRGEAIPQSALAGVLERWRSDMLQGNQPNQIGAGLMKAYHLRMQRMREGDRMAPELKPFLNEEHPEVAYHCGRLMAVLAAIQRAALGDVGAGIVQRYYAAASSTPALVLGRLVRSSQYHLSKLDKGLAYWYEEKLGSIWGRINSKIPTALTLEQQSLFALGYYQQLANLRTKNTDNIEVKEESYE